MPATGSANAAGPPAILTQIKDTSARPGISGFTADANWIGVALLPLLWRLLHCLGMHDTHKHDYLAQAERHIAVMKDRIARQKSIIDQLTGAGLETYCAVSMLHALERCLHAFEEHHEAILERCKTP
jgi:hypothetical protein